MTKVTLDTASQGQFDGLREPAEVCDPAGKILGVFYPAARSESAFSREEIEQRRKERTGAKPLAEIWEDLRKKGINVGR